MAYEFNFDKDKCWYKKICEKYNTEECNKRCIRYSEMDYLMYLSNIPKPRQQPFSLQPQKEDVEAFYFLKDIQDHINEFVANGENLYIYSANTGNGKTCWSIKLIQQYFNNVWYGNRFRCRGLFIFVPAFLNDVKKNINNPSYEFNDFVNRISVADLVIWDDIGANKLSDFDYTQLLSYIDQRKLNLKSNIYTGNLNREQLLDYVGTRLTSRIWNDSIKVELVGIDRRDDFGTASNSK